jgi:hypothetical protein
MRVDSEIYKGIEFVRIFSLPPQQKEMIWQTLGQDKIIKILKEDTLLHDCVQYSDYLTWYHESYKAQTMQVITQKQRTSKIFSPVFKVN